MKRPYVCIASGLAVLLIAVGAFNGYCGKALPGAHASSQLPQDSLFFHFNGEDWIDTAGMTGPSPTYSEGWVLGDCWGAPGSAKYCFSIPSSFTIKGLRVMWFGKDACHFHGSHGGVLVIWDYTDSEWDTIQDIPWNEPHPDEYWSHGWIIDVPRYCRNYCFIQFSALEPDRYELRDGYFVTLYETGVEEPLLTHGHLNPLALGQCTPNPFRNSVSIGYSTMDILPVMIKIYDSAGRPVRVLNETLGQAGHRSVEWDGRDDLSCAVNPGVYFCRLSAGRSSQTVKVVRVR